MIDGANSLLCVGGPLSGQRRAFRSGESRFYVQINGKADLISAAPPHPTAMTMSEFKRVEYQARVLYTSEGNIAFWVPSDLTLLQIYLELAKGFEENYIEKAKKGEKGG